MTTYNKTVHLRGVKERDKVVVMSTRVKPGNYLSVILPWVTKNGGLYLQEHSRGGEPPPKLIHKERSLHLSLSTTLRCRTKSKSVLMQKTQGRKKKN